MTFAGNAVHIDNVWTHILWVFFSAQTVKKEEQEHTVSKKPKRTKEEIEEARQLKIKKKEEEEQSRWRWLGNAALFILHWPGPIPTTHNTIKTQNYIGESRVQQFSLSQIILTFSWSCFLSGGRKRSMKMGWNGSSLNTTDPTSLLITSLCQTTFTSTMTVSWAEMLNVSEREIEIGLPLYLLLYKLLYLLAVKK